MSARTFIEKIHRFIEKQELFTADDSVLLAISGGVDSMCLMYVLLNSDVRLEVAHCNFQLRGEASDTDEDFVREHAETVDLPFYTKRFDTKAYAKRNGVSVQMAARELRYTWFEELCNQQSINLIATAHHKDDEIESFFIHLLRGAGIRGLKGIPVKRGRIIRPFLCVRKQEIQAYAGELEIPFRDDISNLSDIYLRNKIRHHLVPLVEQMIPQGTEKILHSMNLLFQENSALEEALDKLWSDHVVLNEDQCKIILPDRPQQDSFNMFVSRMLLDFGFNATQILDLLHGKTVKTGGIFLSHTHQLLVDRGMYILTALADPGSREAYKINTFPCTLTTHSGMLRLELTKANQFSERNDPNIEYISYSNSLLPLTFRKWEHGDRFQPLGMEGTQKLQDFFTNLKIPRSEKENIYILTSGDRILWATGYRIDQTVRVTKHTKQVLICRWDPK